MADAGCQFATMGVETADNDLLRRMNKKTTVENARRLVNKGKTLGLNVHTSIIFGNVGETEKTIAKTVKSLLNLDYPKDKLELMVIDDGSTDKTYEKARQFAKAGVKVFTKKNAGKAAALNFALKKSTGDFFGALDADSFVNSNALKKMIGHFKDPKIMAVTPSLKVYNPKTILQKIQYIE